MNTINTLLMQSLNSNPHDPSYTTTETKATSILEDILTQKWTENSSELGLNNPFSWVRLLYLTFLMGKDFL